MKRSKKKEEVYKTNEEFERNFYPKSYKKRLVEAMDSHALSASFVEKSLDELRRQLSK